MAPSLVAEVRRFVEAEVRPAAAGLEHADAYPHALVARMQALGLFGALVPAAFGGLGLDVSTYARVIEELCRGWMSLAGVINSHTMAALIVLHHGTDEQRRRWLPRFARGEARGGLCLTEPHAGSDVQAIRTVARRRGDRYVIDGTKMFVTNGREGNTFALLALTDPDAQPRHRGMSCFIVTKGAPGLTVVKSIAKLGYKGVDTAELLFEDFAVPVADLVGGVAGRGFAHVMSGLETGRINIAARAVGVAQAAWEEAQTRVRATGGEAPPALADMATRVAAARALTLWAAGMKDRAERCDLEAGMAKLYASEAAQEVALAALRVHGADGTLVTHDVERYYRDTPLMIIGEGTNEIQRILIARQLVDRYGERPGALTSREGEPEERRLMLLAVRQLVDKQIVPTAQQDDGAGAPWDAALGALAALGVCGAVVPDAYGGLGLDLAAYVMIVEEVARGRSAAAAALAAHSLCAWATARFGTSDQCRRWLPRMARGELLAAPAFGAGLTARRDGPGWRLSGTVPRIERFAGGAALLPALVEGGAPSWFLVPPDAPGQTAEPQATLGPRGVPVAALRLDALAVESSSLLGGLEGRGEEQLQAMLAFANLGVAATAVGLAQAAFEAALRYAQQRSTFGKPIAQHQAIQLKLADMATRVTAARLLTGQAAAEAGGMDAGAAGLVKVFASEIAYEVALDAMRIHGGYGYTTEFPVERYYRDAARLLLTPVPNDALRSDLARRLVALAAE